MRVSIDIPEELYKQVHSLAEARHVTVEEILVSAVADQFAAWQRLVERARGADRDKFLNVLEKVPDIEADEFDRL